MTKPMKFASKMRLLATTAPLACVLVAIPGGAQAQSQDPATAAGATEYKDIVVTGSRIARPELDAATPIAIVGAEQIESQGITNIQDLSQKLPQVGIPGVSRTNSNFNTTGNGIATINLRNLGDVRTLVLVNGRRFVPGVAGTSIVDVNNIPVDFVDRIEVVTGGASAIYGSEAIAGVVNYVLKDSIDGLIARAQTGITEQGDNQNYSASLSGGLKFGADERGSIIANVSYSKDEGLLSRERSISSQDCLYICGPTAYSSYAAQGRFQLMNGGDPTGNDGGYASNLFTFDPNNNVVSGFPTGYGFNRNSVRRISTPVERYMAAASAKYEVAEGITAFLEGTYAKTKSSSQIEPYPLDSDDVDNYSIDNPFIPATIAAQIAARNGDADPTNDVTSIAFRRRQNDVYSRSNRNTRDTFRIAGGFRGDITDKWNFEVSAVYGKLKDHTATEDIDTVKYGYALDAIRDGSGNIVCRDATARAAGCVPINLFGYNTVDPAAASYVKADIPRSDDVTNTEFVATGSVSGSLFALPYGDLKIAVGGEYRREKSIDNWDALTNAGQNSGNLTPDTIGKFDVKEAFGEVDIPVLSGLAFADMLSIQGAARYSSYSTVGDIFSWNAGAEYSPVPGLRFRGNYAVANRAPNISELYSAASETFPSVQDPCNGVTATTDNDYAVACRSIPGVAAAIANTGSFTYSQADLQGINGFDSGNPNLHEEKAKTLTLGAVLSPRALPGFSFTADYFNIKVDDAIGVVSRTTSIQQCLLLGLPQFCNNVIRNPNTGLITTVNSNNVNIAARKTSGIDFDMQYGRNLGLFADDRLDLHAIYTLTLKYKIQSDPSAPVDSGLGNIEYGEAFKSKVYANISYRVGAFSVTWTGNYLSRMVNSPEAEFDTPATYDFLVNNAGLTPEQAQNAVSHNKIAARLYQDMQFRVRAGDSDRFEFYLGVNNLFNVKPPILEDGLYYGSITGTTTASDVYDPFGRRFYAGFQAKF